MAAVEGRHTQDKQSILWSQTFIDPRRVVSVDGQSERVCARARKGLSEEQDKRAALASLAQLIGARRRGTHRDIRRTPHSHHFIAHRTVMLSLHDFATNACEPLRRGQVGNRTRTSCDYARKAGESVDKACAVALVASPARTHKNKE